MTQPRATTATGMAATTTTTMSGMSAASAMAAAASWRALLQASSQEVFAIMLRCPLEVVAETVVGDGSGITAMVGLAGSLCGSLSVHTSLKGAARIADKMVGLTLEETDPQCWDALGEVANMIAGNFKNQIPSHNEQCMLSVPTIFGGASYSMHSLGVSPPISLDFSFDGLALSVRLDIEG